VIIEIREKYILVYGFIQAIFMKKLIFTQTGS